MQPTTGTSAPPSLPRLSRLARALGLGLLEGASVGLGAWAILSHSVLPTFTRNSFSDPSRHLAVVDMAAGGAIAMLLLIALFVWQRGRELRLLEWLTRRCSTLTLAGLVPLVFDMRIWEGRDLVFLAFAAMFGMATRAAVGTTLRAGPLSPDVAPRAQAVVARALRSARGAFARAGGSLLLVLVGALAYATYFSVITITRHRNLGSASFDLGLEDNLMWNLVHGGPILKSTPFDGPTGTHLRNHATFFAYLLAPIYASRPGPETLLILQAAMMGGAAIPLYLYARRHVSPWLATAIAFLYLIYAPLHGANLFDFHYLPLGVFFLWLTLYGVESKRYVLAGAAALVALSVREDVALCLAVLGMFLLLSGRAPRYGALLATVGAAYFGIMKLVVMPHFGVSGSESFTNQYQGLLPPGAHGLTGVLETIVANPVFVGDVVLQREKVAYLLMLLVPVLFLPLARPIGLVLMFPGFLFTLLATGYAPLNEISFQYTSYWTAFVFIGVTLEFERVRHARSSRDSGGAVRQVALVAGVMAASLACSYVYGAIWQPKTLRAGFDPFSFETSAEDIERRLELRDLVALIPSEARVSASEHLLPHVSTREGAYTLRFGTYDADYLLFQLPPRRDERAPIERALRSGTFGVVEDRHHMVLAKCGADTTGNAAVLMRLQ